MSVLKASKINYINIGKYGGMSSDISDYTNIPRPFFSIGLVLSGNGKFYVNNKFAAEVSPGELILIPIASRYISYWSGSPEISYITFHFIFEDGNSPFRKENIPIQKIRPQSDLSAKFIQAHKSFSGNFADRLAFLEIFYGVLSEIFPQIQTETKEQKNTSIKQAIDYITFNCKEHFGIDELAQMVHLSPSRFFAVFKKETGMSPIEYKNRILIQNAEKLLLTADLSIEEISAKLGFNSSSYFRRAFKSITGKSPREYKKEIENNLNL